MTKKNLESSLFVLALITCLTAGAMQSPVNEHTKTVSAYTDQYGNRQGFAPIFILDWDVLEARYVKAGLYVPSGQDMEQALIIKRMKILDRYIKNNSGVSMNEIDLQSFHNMIHWRGGNAAAFPWRVKGFNIDRPVYLCTVIPASPNLNEAQHNERILHLGIESVYGELRYANLTQSLTRKDAEAFSLIHEIAHCLDKTYIAISTSTEDPPAVHKSEVFAEVFAALLLIQKGYAHLLEPRANLRMTYSWMMKDYFQNKPEITFLNPGAESGALIYALYNPLMAVKALHENDSGRAQIQAATLEQLADISKAITEKHAFTTSQFNNIGNYLKTSDKEKSLAHINRFTKELHELFSGVLDQLRAYLKMGPAISEKVLSAVDVRDDNSQTAAPAITIDLLLRAQEVKTCSDVDLFLADSKNRLRKSLYEASGYDVSAIVEALDQVPEIASQRLFELSCLD